MDELQNALTALIALRGNIAAVDSLKFRQTLRDGRTVYTDNRTTAVGEAYGPRLGKTLLSFCTAWFEVCAKGTNDDLTDNTVVAEVMETLDAVLRMAAGDVCLHFVQNQGVTKWVHALCRLVDDGNHAVVVALEMLHMSLPLLMNRVDTCSKGSEKESLQRQLDDALSLLRKKIFQKLPSAASQFSIATLSHVVSELLQVLTLTISKVKVFRMGLILKLDLASRSLYNPEAFDWLLQMWHDITTNEFAGELNSAAFAETFLTSLFANFASAHISILRRIHELLVVVFRARPRMSEKILLRQLAPSVRAAIQEGFCHTMQAISFENACSLFAQLCPDPEDFDGCSLQFLLDLTLSVRHHLREVNFARSWGFCKILELFAKAPDRCSKESQRWYAQHVAPVFPHNLPAAVNYALAFDTDLAQQLAYVFIATSADPKGLIEILQGPLVTLDIVTIIFRAFNDSWEPPATPILDTIWARFFCEDEDTITQLFRAFYLAPEIAIRRYALLKNSEAWTPAQREIFDSLFNSDAMQVSTLPESFFFPYVPELDSEAEMPDANDGRTFEIPKSLCIDVIHEEPGTCVKAYTDSEELEREVRCLLELRSYGVPDLIGVTFTPPRSILSQVGPTLLEFYPFLEPADRIGVCHDILQVLSSLHCRNFAHQSLTLSAVRIDCRRRPILFDFENAFVGRPFIPLIPSEWRPPEILEEDFKSVIPKALDMYAFGLLVGKLHHHNFTPQGLPYHPVTHLLPLPPFPTDLRDLIQRVLRKDPRHRPSASTLMTHRAFSLKGSTDSTPSTFTLSDFLGHLDALKQRYGCIKVEDPLILQRDKVFEQVCSSPVRLWQAESVLGDWRVLLEDEVGVDVGGIGREVIGLFFEQFRNSKLVAATDGVLYIAPYDASFGTIQQWKDAWYTVGNLSLRSLVFCQTLPLEFSPLLLYAAFDRIELPPDVSLSMDEVRHRRGDAWASARLHRLLEEMCSVVAQSYHWLLAEAYLQPETVLDKMEDLVDPAVFAWAKSCIDDDFIEWALLWDIYLKFLGNHGRCDALQAFANGLSINEQVPEVWQMRGHWSLMQSPPLSPELMLQNLEFKPEYGYDEQKAFFSRAIERMDADTLSAFLRFAVGMAALPPSGKLSGKLCIRFVPGIELDRLPAAHTCFWTFDVPVYTSFEQMEYKLLQAIHAGALPFALT